MRSSLKSGKQSTKYMIKIYMLQENYSATKTSKLLVHATTWIDVKGIKMNEKKPFLKNNILYNSIYRTFLSDKIIVTENRSVVARG